MRRTTRLVLSYASWVERVLKGTAASRLAEVKADALAGELVGRVGPEASRLTPF